MSQKQKYRWREMTMGVCYYPEQWEASLWESDLKRMRKAGISVVRVGEFAWSAFEPEEGHFTDAFFARFLDLAQSQGMQVIFGTPTAAPPAWLTEKYPETLNARKDGVLYRHGGRRHYTYNAPKYQELCCRVVTFIASRLGRHPAIVGWQIDNEMNCEVWDFFSQADDAAFRVFLQRRYDTIAQLNDAWGTVFWNQTYTTWEEVHLPRTLPGQMENPHQQLDYFRFISDSVLRFCQMQAEILRQYIPADVFITTNGRFGRIDNHKMQQESLDVYTYDSYPSFAFGLEPEPFAASDLRDRHWSARLNEVRSICPHFGIMEQQAGANGWTTRMEGPAPRPGQLTLWAMQSVAHGADFISFFRWRTALQGTEMYWHGILDYDNRDNRRLEEVKAFHQKLNALQPLCGSRYVAAFALLKDYDNEWDAEADSWHRRLNAQSESAIFAASELYHTPYDILYLQDTTEPEELAAYPVLLYPHPVIATPERVQLLESYVSQGGTLILGCRAGYKDARGHCVMLPQPGLFQNLTGTDVRDFTFAFPDDEPVYADWDGAALETPLFNDVLTPLSPASVQPETQVLARYQNSYFAGEAALIEHRFGKGRVLHLGSTFTRPNVRQLWQYVGILEPFRSWIQAPEELEIVAREKDGQYYLFLLNYQLYPTTFTLTARMPELIHGETLSEGEHCLPAFGTCCLQVPSAESQP